GSAPLVVGELGGSAAVDPVGEGRSEPRLPRAGSVRVVGSERTAEPSDGDGAPDACDGPLRVLSAKTTYSNDVAMSARAMPTVTTCRRRPLLAVDATWRPIVSPIRIDIRSPRRNADRIGRVQFPTDP